MSQENTTKIRLNLPSATAVWRNRPIRYLILCGALLIAAIAVTTAVMLASFRNRALAESERELKNTALILSEQIDRSFQALELVQRSVVEKIQALGIASSEDYARQMSGRDVHLMLKDESNGLFHVDALTLIGADGPDRITASEVAERGGTIAWDILSSLSGRLTRIYHRNGHVEHIAPPVW